MVGFELLPPIHISRKVDWGCEGGWTAELVSAEISSVGATHRKRNKELDESVVKSYFTTASDGKRYNVIYYALEMILAVGFRVRGVRGTQFRQWANAHLSEYLVKGFTIDDARLKNPDGRPDYLDELLARIRDIRASEKRFYQKVRDLFALSSDYRGNEARTNQFYAEVQNKLLYAATGHTAAELVVERSDSSKPNMGLTTWKGGIVRKEDVIVAKNYLSSDEIDTLNSPIGREFLSPRTPGSEH